MYDWLQDAVAGNAHIVTASNRLARELRAAYDDRQLAAGKTSWLTPRVSSLHDWLAALLEDNADFAAAGETFPARIDACSAAIVWEQCLRQQIPDGALNFSGMARQTRRAWQLLCDWSVPLDELTSAAGGNDERMFARTALAFSNKMNAAGWIDDAGLPSLVADLVTRRAVTLPEQVVLAGFDRIYPAVANLIGAAKSAGCEVIEAPPAGLAPGVRVAEFDHHDEEMRGAGAWARGVLEKAPRAKIAIISSNLESEADKVHRLVLEGLAPGWQLGGKEYADAANVSYGRSLSAYPAVHIALLVLKWASEGLTGREISLLLRSKCLGNGDVGGRARLEYAFRQHPDQKWKPDTFADAFRSHAGDGDVKEFFAGLAKLAEFSVASAASFGPADWASGIDELLTALQWPGTQVLDSAEFQLINRWRKLLNEFARIEAVKSQMRLGEAVQRLAALAAETIYQPEGVIGAVQILGTLEAAGMQFDAIRVSGFDAMQWPPQGRASPFLPRALQKKFAMPDATPVDTLEFAQRVFDRLRASAMEFVVSWSRTRDDAEVSISPLLDNLDATSCSGPGDPGWFAAQMCSICRPEIIADDFVPPVAAGERIRGGAYTVQRQALEPFSAFAYGRLGIRHPDSIEPGLGARVRGSIIHDALHNLTAGNPDCNAIRSWTPDERLQRVASAVDAALSRLTRHADSTLRGILALERVRLQSLLDRFIDAELARNNFMVVAVESDIDYQRGNVRLGLRADRLDRLGDGSLMIIDYKTGAAKGFLNMAGEPADLQLIVYADAVQQPVGGLMLINIDSRAITYKGAGWSVVAGAWQRDDADAWSARLAEWKTLVHRAVDGIAAGDARINLSLSASQARRLQILSRQEELKRAD